MNYFTRGFISSLDEKKKKELVEADGGCEHVEMDSNLAYIIHTEKDSFGTVGTCVLCESCEQKREEKEDEKIVVCHDCSGSHPKKNTTQWRWYDFYAAQGDIPLTICNTCRAAPKHRQRVEDDRSDCDSELGYNRSNSYLY